MLRSIFKDLVGYILEYISIIENLAESPNHFQNLHH